MTKQDLTRLTKMILVNGTDHLETAKQGVDFVYTLAEHMVRYPEPVPYDFAEEDMLWVQ